MSVTFEFAVSEAELVRASRFMTLRQRETRVGLMFFGVVAVVGVAYVGRTLISGGDLAWPVLPALGFSLLVLYIATVISPRNTVQMLRKGSRGCDGPVQCVLDDGGVRFSSLGAKGSFEWANVIQCIESREFFLLYLSKGYAQVLPKRVIAEAVLPGVRDALSSWLRERFQKRGQGS